MTATVRFNSTELISQLEKSDNSGCLEIEEGLISWKIYVQQGQLKYINCSAQSLEQLKYYLHYLGWKQAITALKQLPASYLQLPSSTSEKSSDRELYSQVICWLLAEKSLELSQGLKLIEQITKDALQSCLWLNIGTSAWQDGTTIPQWIQEQLGNCPSLNISECLNAEKIRLSQWQNCSEQLLSSHQRPYFNSGWEQKELPSSGSLNQQNLQELAKVIKGRTSIRELSVLLQKDELQVAQILSPYLDYQIIALRNAQPPLDKLPNIKRSRKKVPQSSFIPSLKTEEEKTKTKSIPVKTWKIVCIDDSPTILKEIQRFLNQDKFEVTAIDDPVQAVPIIFRIKPDLILLDITMPKINGYKLCGLLRNSQNCNQTPIIMVTGNTGFIDKARAKIAGATDYFTKPFTKEGLMQIVERYLQEQKF
jgi:two-component system, chemotaxis family, response regulator PixG